MSKLIRVVLDGGDYFEVAAELLTFEEEAVVFWSKGTEIGRHSRSRMTALDLSVGGQADTRSMGAAERLEVIRGKYPNAYRPWRPDHEAQLAARYGEGASVAELAEELGRQPGGIEARLERLGLVDSDGATIRRSRPGRSPDS